MKSGWTWVAVALLSLIPGIIFVVALNNATSALTALVLGLSIVGAAFLLSWAAEVVQLDFSQGLALALLALIAILPEYVVDATFVWLAADDPSYAGYAVANMTGANRLLIGIAWPLVVLIAFFRLRQKEVELERGHGVEVLALMAATLYAFVLPIKGSISLLDMVILGVVFGWYIWRVARMPAEPPHLVGPARLIGSLEPQRRRFLIALLAIAAAAAIITVAKPFARALVDSGVQLGIDEFLLVQWLAPLASEAPEFVVVSLFAWRGASSAALGTLVSSKVNQWTLLVGMLPLVYAIALGSPSPLTLDSRQTEEVFLTAAQSLFAVTLLLNLKLSVFKALLLLVPFLAQLIFPDIREESAWVYMALAGLTMLWALSRWRVFANGGIFSWR